LGIGEIHMGNITIPYIFYVTSTISLGIQ